MIIFEDEHLLVINKPAGMNTHSPSPFAGEGVYEWLKNREFRWANLAIIHRLDKETSGVLAFSKTTLGNQSLTQQFAERTVRKKYALLTDRAVSFTQLKVESALVRAGDKYLNRPQHAGGERAETLFRRMENQNGNILVQAEPITGRTHQIRVHASANGFPILGDKLYGGSHWMRLCLHAEEISLMHPATSEQMTFSAPINFSEDASCGLRTTIIEPELTNAYRLLHGAADGNAGWSVERLGEFLLSQSERELNSAQLENLRSLAAKFSSHGVYHKILNRRVRQTSSTQVSPQRVFGETAQERFFIFENGIRYELSFTEGYSVGLFLDQRENRRRILTNYIAPNFELRLEDKEFSVLNTFSYTCGFSVCAAKAGATVTSLDLSKKYLEWGKTNFALNGIDAQQHDFIYGDAFDWMRRLAKKKRQFDFVILDPPTFSQSKEQGTFQAERDYAKLVSSALQVLKLNGVLLASTNAAALKPEKFLEMIHSAITSAKRTVRMQHYVPQPPDFPITREEPAYLKTIWIRIA